jgi:hypothetical protein
VKIYRESKERNYEERLSITTSILVDLPGVSASTQSSARGLRAIMTLSAPVSRSSERAIEKDRLRILIDLPMPADAAHRLHSMPRVHIVPVEIPEERPRALPAELIRDVEILLCTHPPANFDDMKAVKLIQIASAGYTQLLGLGLVEKAFAPAMAEATSMFRFRNGTSR